MITESFNYNNLKANGFIFSLERIPQTIFRTVSFNLPGFEIPPAQAGYPGASQYHPGTNIEFEPLLVEFIVDDDMKNYEEIYDWCTQQQSYNKVFKPKRTAEEKLVSDGSISFLNNNSTTNRVITFTDLFPINLGGLQFDTTVDSIEVIRCQVTLRYSYFTLIKK